MATDVPIEQPVARAASLPYAANALAGLAATAGVIHLVAAGEHVDVGPSLVAFFVLVGAGQLAAARWIYVHPADLRVQRLVAAASVGIALLWVFSRTTGLPFGPEAGEIEGVGVADTVATLQELTFAAIVVATAWHGERAVAWLGSAIGLRLTYGVLAMTLMMAALGGHEH